MFKRTTALRLAGVIPAIHDLQDHAAAHGFTPCGATQQVSYGFVPPREENGALIESIAGNWIMKVCIESKVVPSDVVDRELKEQCDRIEAQAGRKPGKKERRDLKEEVVRTLLPAAFPKRKHYNVWISESGLVVTDASGGSLDTVITMLLKLLGERTVMRHINTATSPQAAMCLWVVENEPPASFTSDRFLELKAQDESKAVVRYKNHAIDIKEVAEHVKQGKLPTQMAMTWNDRVSFILTESLALKSIAILDVVFESRTEEVDAFDADWAITTAELSALYESLLSALGGEITEKEQA